MSHTDPVSKARLQLDVATRQSMRDQRDLAAALRRVQAARSAGDLRRRRLAFRVVHQRLMANIPELQTLERVVAEVEAAAGIDARPEQTNVANGASI